MPRIRISFDDSPEHTPPRTHRDLRRTEHCRRNGFTAFCERNRSSTAGRAFSWFRRPFLNKSDCLAMPGTEKQPPVLLDMATSRIALGKARVAFNKGEALKDGLVIDHKGQPSNDPGVMAGYCFPERNDNPPLGALTPLGEYKGYGLALFSELLGGMLSGGGTIQPEHPRQNSIINNMFTLVIDPARLVDVSWMQHEVEAIVAHAKASPPVNSDEPVSVAGDPERISKKERLSQGIPIDDATWEQILEGGETLGLTREVMMKFN